MTEKTLLPDPSILHFSKQIYTHILEQTMHCSSPFSSNYIHTWYRAGLDNLYTSLFMNFAKYFYWERLLPVAVDCFGYQAAYQVPFQQNMGKTSPEEAKRLAIAALLRACFHCIVKIILPHPVGEEIKKKKWSMLNLTKEL